MSPTMASKPTYKELEEQIRQLEGETAVWGELISFLDHLGEPVYFVDVERHEVLYANRALREAVGEAVGRSCFQAIQGRDEPCPFCTNQHILGENLGKTYVWEFRNQINHRWYRCIDRAVRAADGRTIRCELAIDITEQKQTADALALSERKYRELYDHLRDGFARTTIDGEIVEFNPAFQRMLGYARDELIGKHHRDITFQRWHEEEEGILREQVFERGYSDVYEKEYVREDGTLLPVELQTYLARDEEGNPSGLWAVVRDLSYRKRVESAYQKSRERSQRLVETMSDGLAVLDAEDVVTYVNPRFCELLGYAPGDLVGRPAEGFVQASHRPRLHERLVHRRAEDRDPFQLGWVRKDGSILNTLVSPQPLHDQEGRFEGSFAVVTDITKLKRAKGEIRYLSQRLIGAAEEERMRISRDLHDEIGQMITALRLGLEGIRGRLAGTGDPTGERRLNELVGVADGLGDRIRQVCAQLHPALIEHLGLSAALGALVNDLSCQRRDVAIEFVSSGLKGRLPAPVELAVYRVCQESLSNVLRHADASRVRVNLTHSHPSTILTVEDDGRGFELREGTERTNGERRGIGLLGMRERMLALGGSLTIRSARGKGTVIRAEVPVATEEADG